MSDNAGYFNPRRVSVLRLTQWLCDTLVFVRNENAMQNVTVRLPEELIDELDAEADEQDVSRSEHIRETVQDRHEADELREEVSELQDRLDAREDRVSELETQLARRSEIEEKVDTLAKREQEGNAPFFIKWYRWWQRRE